MNNSPPGSDAPEGRELARLQDQMLKPARAVNADGSFELGWGTMMLLCGLTLYYDSSWIPKPLLASSWTSWVAYLPLVCMAFAPYAIPKLIKRLITWPRTGYVATPGEVKLRPLLMLMCFGLALGTAVGMSAVLFSELREPRSGSHHPLAHAITLFVAAVATVVLGFKVIHKRQPPPSAYDSRIIRGGLSTTEAAGNVTQRVKHVIAMMFIGVPILLGVVVLVLMYISRSVSSFSPDWSRMTGVTYIAAGNAVLYLMCNGFFLRQHWWRWLPLVAMLIGPVILACAIPHEDNRPGLQPILNLFPPAVMLSIGLIWLLSGSATLLLFVRKHPVPPPNPA